MKWPWQKAERAERAPDGSLMSEWEEHKFEPQPDITAFELAMIIKTLPPYLSTEWLSGPIYFPKDKSDPRCADISLRHFRKIKETQNADH